MYRVKKKQHREKPFEAIITSSGDMPMTSQEELISLQSLVRRPKRVLHSKNPFKSKQRKVSLHLSERSEPLSGNMILKICKCEFAEEVLKLDISGKLD